MTPDEIDELRTYWIGVAFWNGGSPSPRDLPEWIGEDIFVDDADLVLRFRASGSSDLLGVRFSNNPLPTDGSADYLGEPVKTPHEWYVDRQLHLGEQLDTGLPVRGRSQLHDGWVELFIDP